MYNVSIAKSSVKDTAMGAVVFRLSDVESRTQARPDFCPYCGSRLLQGWGWEDKLIEDVQFERVMVHRYRCETCDRTFRHYPMGVDQADQSLRIREAAAILWGLGEGLHTVVTMLRAIGIRMSTSSVWRASESIDRGVRKRVSKGFRPVVIDDIDQVVSTLESLGRVVILQLDSELSFGMGIVNASNSDLKIIAETLSVGVYFVE
jgi:DNA-directed RNA polymerase subunit RPC12/RpoP